MGKGVFPKCNPHFYSKQRMSSDNPRIRYDALRNVSNHFIRNHDVRRAIFEKCDYKCYLCGAKDDLQIDHVISIYQGAKEKISYKVINSYENLMAVCRSCNAAKQPLQEEIWQDDQNKE